MYQLQLQGKYSSTRDPTLFNVIMNVYRYGRLPVNLNADFTSLQNELEYYGLEEILVHAQSEKVPYMLSLLSLLKQGQSNLSESLTKSLDRNIKECLTEEARTLTETPLCKNMAQLHLLCEVDRILCALIPAYESKNSAEFEGYFATLSSAATMCARSGLHVIKRWAGGGDERCETVNGAVMRGYYGRNGYQFRSSNPRDMSDDIKGAIVTTMNALVAGLRSADPQRP